MVNDPLFDLFVPYVGLRQEAASQIPLKMGSRILPRHFQHQRDNIFSRMPVTTVHNLAIYYKLIAFFDMES